MERRALARVRLGGSLSTAVRACAAGGSSGLAGDFLWARHMFTVREYHRCGEHL